MTVPASEEAARRQGAGTAPAVEALATAPMEVIGRLTAASNATFLCRLDPPDGAYRCVYKPVLGERPLWDFPDGTLAAREYASYLISEALGWGIVPPTVLRDGPHGEGMAQLWIDAPAGAGDGPAASADAGGTTAGDLVEVFPVDEVPDGYLPVLAAEDPTGRRVVLAHADDPRLERMAALDAVLNNPDRKGGHVLRGPGEAVYGVDHGICLHADPKLRTVLWGWAHRPIRTRWLDGFAGLADRLRRPRSPLADELDTLLTVREVDALLERLDSLVSSGVHPGPSGGHAIPWPPF